MKIDIYTHIMPHKYLEAFSQKTKQITEQREARNGAVTDLEMRWRVMDRYPEVLQVLTISDPPMETLVQPKDSIELARIGNDELAELTVKYPDKFVAAAACLPMNDIEAALEETDRAITQLQLKGIQISSRINGESLDLPRFKPIFEKMAQYDLPIWIHPDVNKSLDSPLFGRAFESSVAMAKLVAAGIFVDYPNLKIIIHHCGAMVPTLEGRINWIMPNHLNAGHPVKNPLDHFRKFYTDSATYGNTPALMCGYAFFGADHILFGTDSPLGPKYGLTAGTIDSVERMNIPDIDKEKIFLQNAVKLLKIAL